MNQFLATILLWPCNFAPVGWAFCAGQTLSISQNQALFSLIGTFYGGNGTTTFNLPDFRGRIPVGAGSGPGLSVYTLGQMSGSESVTLTIAQMPAHTHNVAASISASNAQATSSAPTTSVNTLAAPYDVLNANPIAGYNNAAPNVVLNTGASAVTTITGGSTPHSNLQPYTAVNYIIALTGIFPSRS